MRKILFILLIIIPALVSAQRFKGGVLLGMNACQIDGDSWYGYNKAGISGGVFVYTELQPRWKGQLEIKYASKGSAAPRDYDYVRKFRLQYIELPVLASYTAYKNLELQGGISFGYLFSAAQSDGDEYVKFNQLPKSTEVALNVGLNYSFFDHFDVNVRYSYSILPIFQEYVGANYGTGAWYNNVFMFTLFFELGSN